MSAPPAGEPPAAPPGQPCVLLKYGELMLKRGNRARFEHDLLRNARHALAYDGTPGLELQQRGGVLVASAPEQSHSELVARARALIGVSVVQPAWRIAPSMDAAHSAAVRLLRQHQTASPSPTFAVRCHRRYKQFPLTSSQIAIQLGAHIGTQLGWRVNLSRPDVELTVEVDQREIFLGTQRYTGAGGLPVGSSGRALVLLSGGYDSPVAAYRALRRGLRCDFLHCSGAPFTDPRSAYKAYAQARHLARFQPGARLFLAPVGRLQRTLATSGAGDAQTIAHRRLYLRLAEALAGRLKAQALVTGDSLGQVASQTLSNLATADQATTLPVLRPLLAFDKREIIDEAQRLGTADIAALPDEDCCQLFQPSRAATRTTDAQLARIEARAQLDTLIDELVADQLQEFSLDFAGSDAPAGLR